MGFCCRIGSWKQHSSAENGGSFGCNSPKIQNRSSHASISLRVILQHIMQGIDTQLRQGAQECATPYVAEGGADTAGVGSRDEPEGEGNRRLCFAMCCCFFIAFILFFTYNTVAVGNSNRSQAEIYIKQE